MRRLGDRAAAVICVSALTLLAIRAWDSQRGPEFEPWHIYAPHEPSRSALATLGRDGDVAAGPMVLLCSSDSVRRRPQTLAA